MKLITHRGYIIEETVGEDNIYFRIRMGDAQASTIMPLMYDETCRTDVLDELILNCLEFQLKQKPI